MQCSPPDAISCRAISSGARRTWSCLRKCRCYDPGAVARTPILVAHEFTIPDVPPDVAWETIADTDSLNQISGLPSLTAREILEAPYGNTLFRIRTGWPMPMQWDERPFE